MARIVLLLGALGNAVAVGLDQMIAAAGTRIVPVEVFQGHCYDNHEWRSPDGHQYHCIDWAGENCRTHESGQTYLPELIKACPLTCKLCTADAPVSRKLVRSPRIRPRPSHHLASPHTASPHVPPHTASPTHPSHLSTRTQECPRLQPSRASHAFPRAARPPQSAIMINSSSSSKVIATPAAVAAAIAFLFIGYLYVRLDAFPTGTEVGLPRVDELSAKIKSGAKQFLETGARRPLTPAGRKARARPRPTPRARRLSPARADGPFPTPPPRRMLPQNTRTWSSSFWVSQSRSSSSSS